MRNPSLLGNYFVQNIFCMFASGFYEMHWVDFYFVEVVLDVNE